MANKWSIGSKNSILSIGSVDSILSIGSAGSLLSIGSAGSVLSVGSMGSFLSAGCIFCVGSILSIASMNAYRAIAQRNGNLFMHKLFVKRPPRQREIETRGWKIASEKVIE